MIQTVRYGQSTIDNTTSIDKRLFTEQGTPTESHSPRRISVSMPLRMSELSATTPRDRLYSPALPTSPSELEILHCRLATLSQLTQDWNGYGAEAPSQYAQKNASEALDILNALNLLPSRIVASSSGGISLVFLIPGGYVDIECFNDGDIISGIQLPDSPPRVEEIILDRASFAQLAEELRRFGYA